MKRFLTLPILLILISLGSFAQKNVIVSIDDKKFTLDEFERIYNKNNTQLNDKSDVKTPEQYVEMFIDYKLKVIEAEKRGLDTVHTFVDELAGYREELAKPYLTNVSVTDSMIKVAYFRTVNTVNVSHILISLKKDASPEDTLKAFNKTLEIRNKYLNKEKTFEELATEYSEDPSAKKNNGELGYFTAFQMITPFEDAAYSTPIGQVSQPVRTNYGYHLILVKDLKPTTGEVKVAHIMKIYKDNRNVSAEEETKIKSEIDSLYTLLKNGADFGTLAKEYSDDKNTAQKNGEMNFISQTFSIKDFADAAFSLEKDGDISKPVHTIYGWHILKRIERKAPPTLEEAKDDLAAKVRKDPARSEYSKQQFINEKRKENGFITYNDNLVAFKNYLQSIKNDTITEEFPENILALNLYKVGDKFYTVNDFWILQQFKKKNNSKFVVPLVLKSLESYKDETVTEYESSQLEKKYPEFDQIIKEYRDGMLLFEIMEDEVWNKAAADTIGFKAFYEQNKGKYSWGKHFDGLLFRCYNQQAKDSVDKLIAAGITDPEVIKTRLNSKSGIVIKVEKNKWEKGQNDRIDYFVFNGNLPEKFLKDFEFVLGEVKDPTVKTLDESKGLYLSDYQQELEKQWIAKLKTKYKIEINEKLLKKVKSL